MDWAGSRVAEPLRASFLILSSETFRDIRCS